MIELGRQIRAAREQMGLSLSEVEEATKIRKKYLQAIEAGETGNLPPAPNARGLLRNLAIFLGLDPEDVIRRYNEAVPVDASSRPPMLSQPLVRKRIIDPELVVGLILVVLVGVLLVWVFRQYVIPLAQRVPSIPDAVQPSTAVVPTLPLEPTPVSRTILPLPTPTDLPTPTPSPVPTEMPTPAPLPRELEVQVNVLSTSWVRVRVDGQEVLQATLPAGSNRTWVGKQRIELRVGNAGGVEATVNGQPLGVLGQPGQVLERAWALGPNGEVQPVATSTPTGTS